MTNKTKIILTIIGLGAIVIPAILLVVFSGNKGAPAETNVPSGTRQIDKSVIQRDAQPNPAQAVPASPSPIVTSPSPVIKTTPSPNLQSTPSGVN